MRITISLARRLPVWVRAWLTQPFDVIEGDCPSPRLQGYPYAQRTARTEIDRAPATSGGTPDV